MLPDGLTIELIDDIIYWKNTTGSISEQEALNIAEEIKELIESNLFALSLLTIEISMVFGRQKSTRSG